MRGVGAIVFRFQPQLPASRVDVVAFFAAQRDGDAGIAEDVGEALLAGDAGSFPGQALDGVVVYKIHVGVEIAGDIP